MRSTSTSTAWRPRASQTTSSRSQSGGDASKVSVEKVVACSISRFANFTPNTLFADFRCPANLNPPPNTPQQGWAILKDVGETFGPCLGRDLYYAGDSSTNTVAFESCNMVRAGRVADVGFVSGKMQFQSRIWFDVPAVSSLAHLTLELVFSHEVHVSGATMDVSTSIGHGSRTNIVRVEVDLAAVAALTNGGYSELTALHVGEGEICVQDAECIVVAAEVGVPTDTRNGTFDPTTYPQFEHDSKVTYVCGHLTAFENSGKLFSVSTVE